MLKAVISRFEETEDNCTKVYRPRPCDRLSLERISVLYKNVLCQCLFSTISIVLFIS